MAADLVVVGVVERHRVLELFAGQAAEVVGRGLCRALRTGSVRAVVTTATAGRHRLNAGTADRPDGSPHSIASCFSPRARNSPQANGRAGPVNVRR
jgi:hypothetical protein